MAASRKSDHSGAVEHFQKAVSIDPELADGYNNLGSAYAALGQLEQAAEQYQKTIDFGPGANGQNVKIAGNAAGSIVTVGPAKPPTPTPSPYSSSSPSGSPSPTSSPT